MRMFDVNMIIMASKMMDDRDTMSSFVTYSPMSQNEFPLLRVGLVRDSH